MQKFYRNRISGTFFLLLIFAIGSSGSVFSQQVEFDDLSRPQLHQNSARISTPRLTSNVAAQNTGAPQTGEVEPQKFGALLLKGGYMYEGEITRKNNDYIISRPIGRSKMPVYTVEYVGKDRYDIYQYKRRQASTASYDGTFNLAKWCLSNGMYDEAIAEFQNCKNFAPFPQAVKALDNEIAAAERVKQGMLARKQAQNDSEHSPDSETAADSLDDSLKTLTDDLEEFNYKSWGLTVDPKIFDKFKKDVEPQLLKRCGSATCHGSNSSQEFRLQRSGLRFSPTEATTRNLKAVFDQLDFEKPESSPLMQRPLQAHGGSKPIFHRQSRNTWVAIYQWIQLIPNTMPGLVDQYIAQNRAKRNELQNNPQVETPQASTMLQTSYSQEKQEKNTLSSQVQHVPSDFSFFTNNRSPVLQVGAQMPDTENPANPAIQPPQFLPKKQGQLRPSDPFDPNVFNQRFHR